MEQNHHSNENISNDTDESKDETPIIRFIYYEDKHENKQIKNNPSKNEIAKQVSHEDNELYLQNRSALSNEKYLFSKNISQYPSFSAINQNLQSIISQLKNNKPMRGKDFALLSSQRNILVKLFTLNEQDLIKKISIIEKLSKSDKEFNKAKKEKRIERIQNKFAKIKTAVDEKVKAGLPSQTFSLDEIRKKITSINPSKIVNKAIQVHEAYKSNIDKKQIRSKRIIKSDENLLSKQEINYLHTIGRQIMNNDSEINPIFSSVSDYNLITDESNSILHQKLKEVRKEDFEHTIPLIKLLFQKMDEHGGIGLAANQIGVDARIFVMKRSLVNSSARKIAFINPVITPISAKKRIYSVGCLSFPNLILPNNFYEQIQITGFAVQETLLIGRSVSIYKLSKLEAVCAQHENDHLNGITFKDHLSEKMLKSLMEVQKMSKK